MSMRIYYEYALVGYLLHMIVLHAHTKALFQNLTCRLKRDTLISYDINVSQETITVNYVE